MKLTALWAVAILSLWIRTSANFSASTVLSLIATPWSALFLRVSCKIKWTKIKNVKHSHPSTTGFAASSPGSPRSPGRWNRNLLKETLLKTIFLFYLNICVMKLTAALEVTHFYHWLWVSSANWGAPAVLSQIAFPRSGLCLRIHENRRRKSQNRKYSHPRTTGLAASAPGSPRSPGRGNRMF